MHSRFFSPVLVLLTVLISSCSNEPKAWMPSRLVIVGDRYHDVKMRRWCNQDSPCELMSQQDVYWQVEPDGQVKIMHIGQELRFERGTFNRPHSGDPSWVVDKEGEYLLATTDTRRALIIHYPLSE